jgi:predicted DNA-binding transcriptional regulator AlpA
MNFTTIEDNEIRKGEIILSWDEVAEMVAIKTILFKFLKKSKLSFQISLGMWNHRWKESEVYAKIEVMDELIQSIDSMEESLNTYTKNMNSEKK